MPKAVVLKDFTDGGVSYHKGDTVDLSQSDYNRFYTAGWIVPTGDGDVVAAAWIPPTGSET